MTYIYTDFTGAYRTIASRGCPFSCNYCYMSYYHSVYKNSAFRRERSVENLINEIETGIKRNPAKAVLFEDDLFPYTIEWLETFSREYRSRINLPFWVYVHPQTVTVDAIRLLEEAGCARATMGLDYLDHTINRTWSNRHIHAEQTAQAIANFKKSKIALGGTYIIGLGNRPIEAYYDDILFYGKQQLSACSVFILRCYPSLVITQKMALAQDEEQLLPQASSLRRNSSRKVNPQYYAIMNTFYLSLFVPYGIISLVIRKKLYRFFPPFQLSFFFSALVKLRNYVIFFITGRSMPLRFTHRSLYYARNILRILRNKYLMQGSACKNVIKSS